MLSIDLLLNELTMLCRIFFSTLYLLKHNLIDTHGQKLVKLDRTPYFEGHQIEITSLNLSTSL